MYTRLEFHQRHKIYELILSSGVRIKDGETMDPKNREGLRSLAFLPEQMVDPDMPCPTSEERERNERNRETRY